MRSFDTKGRRKEGKTREIFTSQLYQNEPIASNELGQLIGRQTLLQPLLQVFPSLWGKPKIPLFGLNIGIWCPKIQQKLVSLSRPIALVLLWEEKSVPLQHKPQRHGHFLQHPFPLYPRIADCNFFFSLFPGLSSSKSLANPGMESCLWGYTDGNPGRIWHFQGKPIPQKSSAEAAVINQSPTF